MTPMAISSSLSPNSGLAPLPHYDSPAHLQNRSHS
jgi:hypothetical protein